MAIPRPDRRHTQAVTEDADRITSLAHELQRNALELENQSRKLRGTIEALEAAKDEVELRTIAMADAQARSDGANARLSRLQRITAALSSTVTQRDVAETVLREAIVALECESGAVVVSGPGEEGKLELLHALGTLDPLMKSYDTNFADIRGPYAESVENCTAVYLESFEELVFRYPAFADATKFDSHAAWIFLPLETGGGVCGALSFSFSEPRDFTTADRHFADTVSRYCAQALDRVRLRISAAAAIAEAGSARALAEQANSSQKLFLRAITHELRTPLNAISGYTEILELGIRGPVNTAQIADLARIKQASAYLLRLVNDVLTVARLEGATPLSVTVIPLESALAEVESLCLLQAEASRVEFSIAPLPEAIQVAADAERFQRILLNLVTNGIKFTGSGGRVTVECGVNDSMVHVSVSDTGIGIGAGDIDRVFEPFVQIDPQLATSAQHGVGLGLSISRELARSMGGDLTCRSTAGSGSTFTLVLPVVASASTGLPPNSLPLLASESPLYAVAS